jgi:hypothetical protein
MNQAVILYTIWLIQILVPRQLQAFWSPYPPNTTLDLETIEINPCEIDNKQQGIV